MKFSMYDKGWTLAEDEGKSETSDEPSHRMRSVNERVAWFEFSIEHPLLVLGDDSEIESGATITVYGNGNDDENHDESPVLCQRVYESHAAFWPRFIVVVRIGAYLSPYSNEDPVRKYEELILVEDLENLAKLVGELRPLVKS